MRKKSNKLIFALLFFMFGFTGTLEATNYYVDQKHPSANDQNAGTADQPWKTITKANQVLRAGDIAYIKAGTYNTYIAPANSGASGARITYSNYGTDVVTISGSSYAVYLNGKSYITVHGINASSCTHFLILQNGASYNIIENSSFNNNNNADWNHSMIWQSSQYNWIRNCQFSKGGSSSSGGDDIGSVIDIGDETNANDHTWYNLIENSIFFHGGHHVVALMSGYNTFRNNYIHNEAWSGGYGDRCLYTNSPASAPGQNIIEGNRWGYAWTSVDDGAVGNVVISSPTNILRYNSIYHSNAYGLGLAGYTGYSNAINNRIYNNTFFNNGLAVSGGDQDSAVWITTAAGQSPTGNVFKNNLYYSHNQLYTGERYSQQTYANEFNGDARGNPLFVSASATPPADKTDSTLPNLNLQTGSPAINVGGALTTVAVADTSSGTSLVVTDAKYFQDGTYSPPGASSADWIGIGTVGNVVQISSINYSTNTITLANSISRNDGDSVWLYKKSDGAQVLHGSAPDVGAYEFSGGEVISPPRNLRIVP